MHVSRRGALVQVHQKMRKVRQPGARAPEHAVERCLEYNPFRDVKEQAVVGERRRHRGELPFFGVDRLSQDRLQDLRMSDSRPSVRSVKITPLSRKLRIKCNRLCGHCQSTI